MAVCFVAGTRIRTTRGEVPVEALAISDVVITASGEARPVRWIGHRHLDLTQAAVRETAQPVRIAAHAFAANTPWRDLLVSPSHLICADVGGEVLVPAIALVNGATVTRCEVDRVSYWHVELDSHDILIANGLPAESYLDAGNRGFFAEAAVVDLTALPDAPAPAVAAFCRPAHGEGTVVTTLRRKLRERAIALGYTLDTSPLADLHLIVDGRRIDPVMRESAARFFLPAGSGAAWLVSAASRPSDGSDSRDDRLLGLCLRGLALERGFGLRHTIAMDDPRLADGFHAVEDGCRRWTDGRAHLPASLWRDQEDGFFLRIDLAGPAVPRWIAPPPFARRRFKGAVESRQG